MDMTSLRICHAGRAMVACQYRCSVCSAVAADAGCSVIAERNTSDTTTVYLVT